MVKKITPVKVTPKLQTKPVVKLEFPLSARARLLRDIAMIESLMLGKEAAHLREAAELGGLKRSKDILDIPGIGKGNTDRRIGGIPTDNTATHSNEDALGFKDPLAGHSHPRSTLVGPATIPGKGDLVGQDSDSSSDSFSQDADRSHRGVWEERHTERTSSDGNRTWGSTLYTDTSGNHWRVDYHDERRGDGSVVSKSTVFDSHGEPIKTTVREGWANGEDKETTTSHVTGETTTTTGKPDVHPTESQPGEYSTRGGDNVAPRGWYDPISGVVQNPGIATSNNKVNPGPDAEQNNQTSVSPLRLDPLDLVKSIDPDNVNVSGGTPTNIRHNNPTIVDPPRPQNE